MGDITPAALDPTSYASRNDALYHLGRFSTQPWKTLLKTALVRLPRAVPIQALRLMCPEGPQPFQLDLPSRSHRSDGRTIAVYVFVPPVEFPIPNTTPPAALSPDLFPVVVDFHGGGFYLGSCFEQAPFCAKLARELRAVVIGVDYRMAPLDPFPAAIEDAEDVAAAVLDTGSAAHAQLKRGIAEHLRERWYQTLGTKNERKHGKVPRPPQPNFSLDTTRVAFSGASSGGNIALNLALNVPKSQKVPEGWPSKIPPGYGHQIPVLLLYPSLDLQQLPSERHRHERMPPKGDKKKHIDIDDHLAATYVSRELSSHPRASPGLVDTGAGLHATAKILLILSGLDTLWEQSERWVKKVEAEGRGGDMKVMRYEDKKHGWTQMPESWLTAEEKKTRLEVLDECVRFAAFAWEGRDPVAIFERERRDTIVASSPDEHRKLAHAA